MKSLSCKPLPRRNERIVYKGERYRVTTWEQQMYDGTWQTFERVAVCLESARVIAVTEDGDIVVIRQHQPHWTRSIWSLPGGLVDKGETPLMAAQRELREEAGYAGGKWHQWKVIHGRHIDYTSTVFIACGVRVIGAPTPDAGEELEVHTMPVDAFLRLVAQDDFRHDDMARDVLRMMYDSAEHNTFLAMLGLATDDAQ